MNVIIGLLVGIHNAHLRAKLYGHIADGHALFHSKMVNRITSILDHMTDTCSHTISGNQSEDKVLGIDTFRRHSSKFYQHFLRLDLPNGLRGKDVLYLRSTDSKSNSSKSSVSGRVTIATDDEFARLSLARFGSNHMNNSLQFRSVSCMLNTKILDILRKFINLSLGNHIPNIIDIDRRNIMIKGPKSQIRPSNFASCISKTLKSLRAGYFMNIMLIHIHKLGLTFFTCYQMPFPQLIKNRFSSHTSFSICNTKFQFPLLIRKSKPTRNTIFWSCGERGDRLIKPPKPAAAKADSSKVFSGMR